jgi:hypothetical protein
MCECRGVERGAMALASRVLRSCENFISLTALKRGVLCTYAPHSVMTPRADRSICLLKPSDFRISSR